MVPLIDKTSIKDLLFILENKVQDNFRLPDFGLLKLYGMIFGLVLGAYFPQVVKMFLIPLVLFFLVLMGHFIYLILKRD